MEFYITKYLVEDGGEITFLSSFRKEFKSYDCAKLWAQVESLKHKGKYLYRVWELDEN